MKKTIGAFLVLTLMVAGGITLAQQSESMNHRSVGAELDVWVTKTAEVVIPAADAMPEDKYSFAPVNGEFKGVRTFGEQIKHFSATNYILAARILGENSPRGEKDEIAPDSIKSKAEIMEYLRGSFVYLHKAAAAINEGNENELIGPKRTQTRPGFLVDALLHSQNHYGQMVEYLRMNGIVPPQSR